MESYNEYACKASVSVLDFIAMVIMLAFVIVPGFKVPEPAIREGAVSNKNNRHPVDTDFTDSFIGLRFFNWSSAFVKRQRRLKYYVLVNIARQIEYFFYTSVNERAVFKY